MEEETKDPEDVADVNVGDVRFIDDELNKCVDIVWEDPYAYDPQPQPVFEVIEE